MLSLDTPSLLHAMTSLYEIHCYQGEVFQYVVARTNKLSEEKVREDVKKMNHALGSEIHKRGIKYVFCCGCEFKGCKRPSGTKKANE